MPYVIVPVCLVAFFTVVLVVVIIKWKKTKGNKIETEASTEMTLNSAETQSGPPTNQDTAGPEDGVCYASISYTKKTKSKAKGQGCNDDDEGSTVIYSAVKASSDPRDLYSTIRKSN